MSGADPIFEEDGPEGGAARRPSKSEAAFRTISEVSDSLDVPQHVLRFWESKFPLVKPLKRGGGRRYYRPEDVLLLKRIRDLLYRDGYTIRGVQKLLKDTGRGRGEAEEAAAPAPVPLPGGGSVKAAPAPTAGPAQIAVIETPKSEAGRQAVIAAVIDELEAVLALLASARKPGR